MRESRTYGSVRGARDEIRVPTATVKREGGLKLYASGEDLWMAVSYLCGFAAALFELFARAAGARIVTADLGWGAGGLGRRSGREWH